MKKEISALLVLTTVMFFAIISHVVHNERVAKVKEPIKFAVIKDWKTEKNLKKIAYYEHLSKTK